MAANAIALSLDLKGLSCPLPIARTAKAMRELPPGALVEVFVTDPGSVADFRAWAQATGHTLVESVADTGFYRYVVQKREV